MKPCIHGIIALIVSILSFTNLPCFANEDLFKEARTLQRSGEFDEAIIAYKG